MELDDVPSEKELEPEMGTNEDVLKIFHREFQSMEINSELKAAMEAVGACSFCNELEVFYLDNSTPKAVSGMAKQYTLSSLHRPCERTACRSDLPAGTRPNESVFCARCQHLRIYHSGCCNTPREETSVPFQLHSTNISIRSIEEIQTQSANCALCSAVLGIKRRRRFQGCKVILKFGPHFAYLSVQPDRTAPLGVHKRKEDLSTSQAPWTKDIWIAKPDDMHLKEVVASCWEQPEWDTINSWLTQCRTKNPNVKSCRSVRIAGFKLIDVDGACIVVASHEQKKCEYAALSYVWGVSSGEEEFELKTMNLTTLQKPGSLSTTELPLTIKDAMIACKNLRIPYVWVDRLCIIQDEETDKRHNVENMDAIFMASVVTLVALTGIDAAHGLLGVSTRPRCSPQFFAAEGMKFLVAAGMKFWTNPLGNFDHEVEFSQWITRGWTYKEATLSPRLLYFTDEQIVAESNLLGERGFAERTLRFMSVDNFVDRFESCTLDLPKYSTALAEFSWRNLTYGVDRVRAFSGVIHAMYGEDHLFGLPFEHFDLAILWEFKDCPLNQIPYSPKDQSEDGSNLFPSWSWA